MKIAVASGKGGTGKTTLALALALSSASPVTLLDCDVEEPNCSLFLETIPLDTEKVFVGVPEIDESRCRHCGECARFCQFNALASLGDKTLVFDELCHNCGGCLLICPGNAVVEKKKEIGIIGSGSLANLKFAMGRLNVGYPMSPPLIRSLISRHGSGGLVIIDSPPGASCPMVEAVKHADFIVFVTDSTPFGLHDLKIAVEVARKLAKSFAVVVNRDGSGDNRVSEYCKAEDIEILLKIRDDRRVAEAYSEGKTLLDALPEYKKKLNKTLERIMK